MWVFASAFSVHSWHRADETLPAIVNHRLTPLLALESVQQPSDKLVASVVVNHTRTTG